mmetsp:Transcript_9310/g.29746  ORF Transcript_9310/g.29746 Transcript_9310/m.29746 type:complete len:260 (-) Transcript_9310:824-1603(-)
MRIPTRRAQRGPPARAVRPSPHPPRVSSPVGRNFPAQWGEPRRARSPPLPGDGRGYGAGALPSATEGAVRCCAAVRYRNHHEDCQRPPHAPQTSMCCASATGAPVPRHPLAGHGVARVSGSTSLRGAGGATVLWRVGAATRPSAHCRPGFLSHSCPGLSGDFPSGLGNALLPGSFGGFGGSKLVHLRSLHGRRHRPGPPLASMSTQLTHTLQLLAKHPLHSPQRRRFAFGAEPPRSLSRQAGGGDFGDFLAGGEDMRPA